MFQDVPGIYVDMFQLAASLYAETLDHLDHRTGAQCTFCRTSLWSSTCLGSNVVGFLGVDLDIHKTTE